MEPRAKLAYLAIVLKESLKVVVITENGVSCQTLEENLMHCNSLLEKSQIFPRNAIIVIQVQCNL